MLKKILYILGVFLLLTLLAGGAQAASKTSQPSVKNAKIALEPAEFTYDGTAHVPSVTVTLKGSVLTEGTDYTLAFEDNTEAGKATVRVTGIGDYTGKAKKQFTIRKAENVLSADPVVLVSSAEKQEFALQVAQTGDAALTFKGDGSALTAKKTGMVSVKAGYAGTTKVTVTAPATKNYKSATLKVQVTVQPPVPSLSLSGLRAAGRLELSWDPCAGANAYEIEYSADPDFAEAGTLKVKGKKTVSASLDDLPKTGSDWYVRIRSVYDKEKKTVCTSDWSEPQEAEVPLAVVLLGSDYQNNKGTSASENLEKLLKAVGDADYFPDTVVMCGDYSDQGAYYSGEPGDSMCKIENAVKAAFDGFDADRNLYFIEGNHDCWLEDGFYAEDGLHDMGSWLMIVMNTYTMNPWRQGLGGEENKTTVQNAAKKLAECLNTLIEKDETRPVVIATHVPLHFSDWTVEQGDDMYSGAFFDVLNSAAESLNILFVFGHNHGSHGDASIGGARIFLSPGDDILIPDPLEDEWKHTELYRRETLNFYYMTAGYVGYTSDSPKNTHQSMALLVLYEDRLTMLRYGVQEDGGVGRVSLGLAGNRTSVNWPVDYLSEETEDYVLGF